MYYWQCWIFQIFPWICFELFYPMHHYHGSFESFGNLESFGNSYVFKRTLTMLFPTFLFVLLLFGMPSSNFGVVFFIFCCSWETSLRFKHQISCKVPLRISNSWSSKSRRMAEENCDWYWRRLWKHWQNGWQQALVTGFCFSSCQGNQVRRKLNLFTDHDNIKFDNV